MAQEIRLSSGTFGLLLGSLLLALLALAFLLGRMSSQQPAALAATATPPVRAETPTSLPLQVGQVPPPSRPEVPSAPPPAPAASPASASVAPAAPPPAPPPAPLASPPAVPPVVPAPAAPPAAPSPVPKAADAPELRRYFEQIDRVLAHTAGMGDANQHATELLQQSMNGDSSGFDRLQSETRQALGALRQIRPPSRCGDYHRLLLHQLEESLTLVKELRSASSSLDTSGLQSLAARGHTLQAEADRLKELETRLRADAL